LDGTQHSPVADYNLDSPDDISKASSPRQTFIAADSEQLAREILSLLNG
jgi:hypothetical protein